MKKFLSMLSFVLMLVCVGFAFTSCGGDDDDEELDPSNPIVGTWMTEKQAGAYGTVTFRKNGTLSMGVYIPEEMKIDNKFIRESIEKSMPIIEGTYTADGSKINVSITKYCLGEVDLTEYLKIPTQTSTYSISKDNKKLTVKFNEFYSGYAETRVYTRMK